MYRDEYHPQVKKDIKKLTPNLREAIKNQYISEMLLNPEKGEPLSGDLNGINSYHFTFGKKKYRIAYVIDEKRKTIFVLMIAKRGEFYTLLKRRIKG